jgi:hypothetical protein
LEKGVSTGGAVATWQPNRRQGVEDGKKRWTRSDPERKSISRNEFTRHRWQDGFGKPIRSTEYPDTEAFPGTAYAEAEGTVR